MKNKDFDHIIQEKLARLDSDFTPDKWDRFTQRLEEAGMGASPQFTDESLDELVFDKLHRHEVAYNPATWKSLARKIRAEFGLSWQILRYKSLELLVMALVLFLFGGIYQNQPTESHQQNQLRIVPITPTTPADHTPHSAPEANSSSAVSQQTNQQPIAATSNNSSLPATSKNSTPANPYQDSGSLNAPTNDQLETIKNTPSITDTELADLAADNQLTGVVANPLAPLPLPEQSLLNSSIEQIVPAPDFSNLIESQFAEVDLLPSIQHSLLAMEQPAPFEFDQLIKPVKNRLRIGMFLSPDYNRIITPSRLEKESKSSQYVQEESRYSLGYSGGLTLGIGLGGKWEIETGAIYEAKQYRSQQVIYQSGKFSTNYFTGQFTDFELNILNIPLNAYYHFVRKNKWRVYAMAGASMQVAFRANYYAADQGRVIPAPVPIGSSPTQAIGNMSDGLLDGGNLKNNGFITGNVGFGVEKYFATKFSLFAQPTYQHSLYYFNRAKNGLGPFRDRIHTMSFLTGVRVDLR